MTTIAISNQNTSVSFTNVKSEVSKRSELAERLFADVSHNSFCRSSLVRREIEQVDTNTLGELFEKLSDGVEEQDVTQCVEKLSEILPLDQLEKAVRVHYPKYTDALETGKKMLYEAKHYLAQTEHSSGLRIMARFTKLLDSLLSILESLLNAFGIASLFKPSENDFHADMKSQKVMMLLSLFTMLTTLLVPIIGASLSSLIIGGTLLTLTALSLIYPHIKPMPIHLPKAENWSKLAEDGSLFAAEGRKETLDDIANTLLASKKVKTHPMLIGKTGIGKTQTVKAFVQALERGDYPELKGKKVFYINTANLINAEGMFESSNNILYKISEAMGRHRENIILIFDEIHLACQDRSTVVIGEQLKTLLDDGHENFPYVIGITTEEEFFRDIFVNHSAFARRFKRINIDSTGASETQAILYNHLLKESPTTLVDTGSLAHLFTRAQQAFGDRSAQPATSLRILSECIRRTNEIPLPSQKALNEMNEKLRSLHQSSLGTGGFLPYDKPGFENIQACEAEIRSLKKALENEMRALKKIQKAKESLAKAKLKMCKATVKLASLAADQLQSNQPTVNSFLLLSHFLAPILEKTIRKESAQLGLPTSITSSLIDEVIKDELANQEKAQRAVALGREQIRSRQERVS